LLGVSRVTVHRWEHDQRTVSKDHLAHMSEQYGKSMRWFLTFEEGDVDPLDRRYDTARRIYHRISEMPERYRAMVERVVDEMVVGLDGTEK
jgi:transcriptional regulator with XRE-family HTH domain